jgi:hypothetical protein
MAAEAVAGDAEQHGPIAQIPLQPVDLGLDVLHEGAVAGDPVALALQQGLGQGRASGSMVEGVRAIDPESSTNGCGLPAAIRIMANAAATGASHPGVRSPVAASGCPLVGRPRVAPFRPTAPRPAEDGP